MDLLKKTLLIAFYLSVIAVGIIGFLTLRSMRQIPLPVQEVLPQEELILNADSAKADSAVDSYYPVEETLDE